MPEQLMQYGLVIGYADQNPSCVEVTDGYNTVIAVVGRNQDVRIGRTYLLSKRGATYFIGQEVQH